MEISVAKIEEETNYWFVRTQQGDYYQEFFLDNFIAVNWDEFNNPDLLKSNSQKQVIELIKKAYPDEAHPGLVYKQLNRFFFEMKIGDVVLIPSKRSSHISFGIIQSEVVTKEISEDEIAEGACPFQKRRSVQWLKTIKRENLDPYLFMLFYSQHTITHANDYATFIDRSLHSLYIKGDKAHIVLNVTNTEQIYARDLLRVLDGTLDLIDDFNHMTESSFDTNQYELKVNVQSPGPVEIIAGTAAIFLFTVTLHYIIGGKFESKFTWKDFFIKGETDGLLEKIMKFREQSKNNADIEKKIEEIRGSMDRLELKVPDAIVPPDAPSLDEDK